MNTAVLTEKSHETLLDLVFGNQAVTAVGPAKLTAQPPAEHPADAQIGNCISTPAWTNEQYHADKSAVSCSVLKQILRSPAHMLAYKNEPNKETNARLIGNALHAAVLEPDLFSTNYVQWDGGDRTSKKYNEFKEANQGKHILKTAEMQDVIGMRDAIMSFQEFPIGHLLSTGVNESSIVWTDEKTGVRCKIRPDNLNPYGIKDLKTTDDVRPRQFVRQCVKLDYDIQSFMYREGVYIKTGEYKDFYFIAVETNAPYAVWVHQASPEMLASGELKFRTALQRYKACLESAQYPGYESPSSMIEWPKYA